MNSTKAPVHYNIILGRVLCVLRKASGVSYDSSLVSAALDCGLKSTQTALHRVEAGRTPITVLRLARMHRHGLTFGWAPDNILWAVSQVVERLEAEGAEVVYDRREESGDELFVIGVNRRAIDHVVSRVLFDSEEESAPTTDGEDRE